MNDAKKGNDIELADDVSGDEVLLPMSGKHEMALDKKPGPMQLAPNQSQPDRFVEMALQSGDMAKLEKMLELKERYDKEEARKAFHVAMAEFKKNPPRVVKDLLNKQYDNSAYVSIGNMVNTVNEAMGPFGLNARWGYPESEDNTIIVSCILAHTLGHEETVTAKGMPDTSGKKNPLQEARSTRTYLKLDTFEAVTGMASVVGNLNDDGNASGTHQPADYERITEDQANEIYSKIETHDLDKQELIDWLRNKFIKVNIIEDIPSDYFSTVMMRIDSKIKIMKKKADEDT